MEAQGPYWCDGCRMWMDSTVRKDLNFCTTCGTELQEIVLVNGEETLMRRDRRT